MKQVRVRIAPSPTGDPHVGTPYMALFNLIFAKHHKGKFILRIEDTDQSRSRPEYEATIYEALKWCGLKWDEGPDIGGDFGPYRQSERTAIYREYCQKLIDKGEAYKCFATPDELAEMRELQHKLKARVGYDRRYRNLSDEEIAEREKAGEPYVIRLKVPLQGECVFEDMLKGRIACPWADVDDQILLKSDGYPTYHLANVVDDHLMEISHVIRGEEWISSTPKHIRLYEAFGWEPPRFLHMPLLLGSDGKKLSKRKNPTSVFFYRDSGYLPEAFMNFLSLTTFTMQSGEEVYSLDQIIQDFDTKRIGVSGAVFDIKKLDWINQQYIINSIPVDKLWDRIRTWGFSDQKLAQLMPLCHTRIKTFSEFFELCDIFFIQHVPLKEEILCVRSLNKEQAASMLQAVIWSLEEQENWGRSGIEKASRDVAEAFGVNHKKDMMRLLFGALMGRHQGPPLYDSVQILGKDLTRARLLNAILFLGGLSKKKLSRLEKCWANKACTEIMAEESPD